MAGSEFSITGSRHFIEWLARSHASILFSTYQAGKLFALGMDGQGRLSVFERSFDRAMGFAVDDQCLWLATRLQLWRLENMLEPGDMARGFDRMYLPQAAYMTGDIDAHEVHLDAARRPLLASSLFNCLARTGETFSIAPCWLPPFISDVRAEDRCHLNGFAMRDGVATHVTCVSTSNIVDGWRDQRRNGGVVVDVASGEIACSGLSMQHSPRWYRGRLWVLDSGNGLFGWVDAGSGRFEPVAECPGYARGLDFLGDHAVIGLSLPRDPASFSGLAVADRLERAGTLPRCGLLAVNLATGAADHWLRFEGPITELFDVRVLPGARRVGMVGLLNDEIARTFKIELGALPPRSATA